MDFEENLVCRLQIIGSADNFGASSIETQFVAFDVAFFKSVEKLEVDVHSTQSLSLAFSLSLDCVQTSQIIGN